MVFDLGNRDTPHGYPLSCCLPDVEILTFPGSALKSRLTVCPFCSTPWTSKSAEILAQLSLESELADRLWLSKLSWSPHVETVISKVCRKIGILQRNKHVHQLKHFARRLFNLAIIQPDLEIEYAAVSTVPFMSASLRGRLCSVWRRAVYAALLERTGKPMLPQYWKIIALPILNTAGLSRLLLSPADVFKDRPLWPFARN